MHACMLVYGFMYACMHNFHLTIRVAEIEYERARPITHKYDKMTICSTWYSMCISTGNWIVYFSNIHHIWKYTSHRPNVQKAKKQTQKAWKVHPIPHVSNLGVVLSKTTSSSYRTESHVHVAILPFCPTTQPVPKISVLIASIWQYDWWHNKEHGTKAV